jgi:hypothetical protein
VSQIESETIAEPRLCSYCAISHLLRANSNWPSVLGLFVYWLSCVFIDCGLFPPSASDQPLDLMLFQNILGFVTCYIIYQVTCSYYDHMVLGHVIV